MSPSNLTKYCACHKKNHCSISEKISENGSHVISNAGPIREWSDHDPSMKPSVRTMRRCNRSYFSGSPRAFSIEKYDVSCPVLHSNIHQVLRLPRKVTLERHQELRLPRKATRTTRRNRSYFSGSPRAFSIEKYNISRPILHSNIHHVLHLPQKVTLELHQVLRLPRKWHLNLQMLHLPRKVTPMLDPRHIWKLIYNARSNRCHHPTSPNTAPATKKTTAAFQRKFQKTDRASFPMRGRSENDPTMIRAWNRQSAQCVATEVTFRARPEHFLLKNTTFRAQSYIQTFTKCCACHEKWHLNVTKYCACHKKWHLNFPKYCACPKHTTLASHSYFTRLYFTRLFLHTLNSHYSYFTLYSYFTRLLLHTTLTSHYSYFALLLLHTTLNSDFSYFTLLLLHTTLASH